MNTEWPQLITAFFLVFVMPGKFIDTCIVIGLLYWGGFWTVHP